VHPEDRDSLSPLPSDEFANAFKGLLDKIKKDRKMSLRSLAVELKRRGVDTSHGSLSKFGKGELVPTEELVRAVCQVARVPDARADEIVAALKRVRHRQANGLQDDGLRDGGKRATRRIQPGKIGTFAGMADRLKRAKLGILAVTTIVVLVALGVAGLTYLVTRPETENHSATGPSGNHSGGGKPITREAADCDRYKVGPRDLWLRDESGGPRIEIGHDQQLTVETRDHPANLPYWNVVTDDGQKGWVDGRYLVPLCD